MYIDIYHTTIIFMSYLPMLEHFDPTCRPRRRAAAPRWFDDFMETYLRNAAQLRRNDLAMLPPLGSNADPGLLMGMVVDIGSIYCVYNM